MLRTKREVDDRVLTGISETHESTEDEGWTVEVIDAGAGVSLKHREEGNGKPPLYFPKLLVMANI